MVTQPRQSPRSTAAPASFGHFPDHPSVDLRTSMPASPVWSPRTIYGAIHHLFAPATRTTPGPVDDSRPQASWHVASSVAIVPIGHLDDLARSAVDAALKSGAREILAVRVCDPRQRSESRQFEQQWDAWNPGVTIVFLHGREEHIATPIVDYVHRNYPDRSVLVFVSPHTPPRTMSNGLINHHANQLEQALRHEPNFIICRAATPKL